MEYCCEDLFKLREKGVYTYSMFKDKKLHPIVGFTSIHTDKECVDEIFYCPFCGQKLKSGK